MVHIHDVRTNDIVHVRGNEMDPIVDTVERDGERVKLHYKPRPNSDINSTNWLHPASGGHMFIHDLHNGRPH